LQPDKIVTTFWMFAVLLTKSGNRLALRETTLQQFLSTRLKISEGPLP